MLTREEKIKILEYDGVNLIHEGFRTKNNIQTSEECTVISVNKKLPKDEIPENQILPKDVDVIENPIVIKLESLPYQIKRRPVIGGISGMCDTPGYVCTAGLVVYDNINKKPAILTNNHCLGYSYISTTGKSLTGGTTNPTTRKYVQPSMGDGGSVTSDFMGMVTRTIPFHLENQATNIDAGICLIDNCNVQVGIHGITNNPITFSNLYSIGTNVMKCGRTTGVTTGQITSVNASFNIPFNSSSGPINIFFENCLMISTGIINGNGLTQRFSAGGDSGSVVLTQSGSAYSVIGLHFAGSDATSTTPSYAMSMPINIVANALNISAWDGHVVLNSDYGNTITLNGRTYNRGSTTTNPVMCNDSHLG